MNALFRCLLGFGFLILLAGTATADGGEDQAFIKRFLNEGHFERADFSPSFLNQISTEQLKAVASKLLKSVGKAQSVTGEDGRYRAITPSHEIDVRLKRDGNGRIAVLLFKPPKRLDSSVAQVLDELKQLPGRVALTITRDGETLQDINGGETQGVGSGFKIGVLLALQRMIDTGEVQWSTVVQLTDHDRSLPSGQMHKWRTGSPVTLHTAAALMISRSDNTATDLLMNFIGQEKVAEVLGLDVVLTTRDFFVLKASPLETNAWRNGTAKERREQLERLAILPLPSAAAVFRPFDGHVEWLLPAERLCAMMNDLGDHPIMAINPGLASGRWDYAGYKGGNSPGVLSYTHRVVERDKAYCVSISWNGDEETDTARFTELTAELLSQLRKELP